MRLFRLCCKIEKATISAPLRSRVALVSVSLNHFRPLSSTTVSQSRRLSNKKLHSQKLFSVERGGKLRKVWLLGRTGPTDGVGETDSTPLVALVRVFCGLRGRWIRVADQTRNLCFGGEFRLPRTVLIDLLFAVFCRPGGLRHRRPDRVHDLPETRFTFVPAELPGVNGALCRGPSCRALPGQHQPCQVDRYQDICQQK